MNRNINLIIIIIVITFFFNQNMHQPNNDILAKCDEGIFNTVCLLNYYD